MNIFANKQKVEALPPQDNLKETFKDMLVMKEYDPEEKFKIECSCTKESVNI